MTRPKLSEALKTADMIHGPAVLSSAISRMGAEIGTALVGESAVFLTIMQGGLVFAGQLATAIDADLEFDYVHATRFRGTTEGGELKWMRRPDTPLAGRIVVLVDDILDVIAPAEELGKTPGKDAAQGKRTFVTHFGMEKARAFAQQESEAAQEALSGISEGKWLRDLASYLAYRCS